MATSDWYTHGVLEQGWATKLSHLRYLLVRLPDDLPLTLSQRP